MQSMTQLKNRRIRFAIALAGIAFVSADPIDQASAQTKIVEGFVSHGALQWPEYIATDFGWFNENGVEVDMLVVGGGAAQQVAAGALNIGYSGFPDFIRATNAGAPVKIFIDQGLLWPSQGRVTSRTPTRDVPVSTKSRTSRLQAARVGGAPVAAAPVRSVPDASRRGRRCVCRG